MEADNVTVVTHIGNTERDDTARDYTCSTCSTSSTTTTVTTTTTTIVETTATTTTIAENVEFEVTSASPFQKTSLPLEIQKDDAADQARAISGKDFTPTPQLSVVSQQEKDKSRLSSLQVDPPGVLKDTHLHIDSSEFIRHVLNEDGKRYDAVSKASHTIAANPAYRAHHQAYVNSFQPSRADTPEALLMKLFNHIDELVPSCGLTTSSPLKLKYESKEFPDMETAMCGVAFREETPPDGSWPIIAIDSQKPDVERLPLETTEDQESKTPASLGSFSHQGWSQPKKIPHPVRVLSSPEMPDAVRLTKYVFSIMAATGLRRHMLGILVKGFDLFLCYYDRAGGIYSSRVHIVDDEIHLITAIISISLCTPTQLGIEPCIQPPPGSPAATSISGCAIDVDGRRLVLDTLLHSPGGEFGRGAVVFSAHPSPSPTLAAPTSTVILPDTVVVKLSWQITTLDSEDELLRHAAKHNVEGIAKLYLSSVPAKLSDGVRRNVVKLKQYVDRELRVQVMGPFCIPLYKVPDLDDFKAAYISLVKAHHDLYEKAGILHRDVSINNLMVDSSNHRIGVLIDFDFAVIVRDEDGNDVPLKPILTGTLPFLATDLLQDAPPSKTYYRHDLESFFYSLVWIATYYQDGELTNTTIWDTWYKRDWEGIRGQKSGFLVMADRVNTGEKDYTSPQYRALELSWILSLRRFFSLGFGAQSKHRQGIILAPEGTIAPDFDEVTLDGHVTYDKFMNILTSM